MLVQNLRLSFSHTKDNKIFLITENGLEVSLPTDLLTQQVDQHKPLYLNLDTEPVTSGENQKKILNELLDSQE